MLMTVNDNDDDEEYKKIIMNKLMINEKKI